MSYELDNLKREVDSLKWQKAENYKLESLESKVIRLEHQITDTINLISSLTDKVNELNEYIKIMEESKT